MSRHQTADEARAELEATLGSELGAALHELQQDLAWLHVKWKQYRELYGTKPERIKLLNDASPMFFRIVDDALWDDTLLHICRLTDPAGLGKRQRLSIRQLPALIPDESTRDELDRLIAVAVDSAAFARDWRNRRIAHKDLAHALDPRAEPLAAASRQAVEQALHALREVLNCVNGRLRSTGFKFELTDHMSDAMSLLYVLRDGIAARNEQQRALEEGRIGPPDWGIPPAV
jgi:hypothetical protein